MLPRVSTHRVSYALAMKPSSVPLQMRGRRRTTRIVVVGLVAVVVTVFGLWYAHTPSGLPTTSRMLNASGVAGEAVYVGVFTPPSDFGRTLHLSGVKVHTTANTQVTVTPLLCRGGAVGVTTTPESFCTELVNPEGQDLSAGDGIVLEVSSELASIAVVDRVRLGFRDGVQWGTEEAGSAAVVRIYARQE